MVEQPEKLVEGMRIILQLFPHAKGVFGVEDNKPDCIQKLRELTAGEDRMTVVPLMTKYPQGGERQLIYAVTGRSINSKMLPADVGCIVDNVETIVAIYHAVKLGQPLTTGSLPYRRRCLRTAKLLYQYRYQLSGTPGSRRGADQTGKENDFRRPDDGIRPV